MSAPKRTEDSLLGKMWKTKSARFNAHQRLLRRHTLSIWATSILAFYVFVTSVTALVYPKLGTGDAGRAVLFLTVIISVFLMITTLLETSKNYQKEADRMLKSGLDISRIYNRFQALPPERREAERCACAEEYSETLEKQELNHRDIDILQFQIRNARELDTGWLRTILNYVRYGTLWMAEYWLYIVLVFVPPIGAFLLRRQFGIP